MFADKSFAAKNAAYWKQVEASVLNAAIKLRVVYVPVVFLMNIQLLLQSAAGSRVRSCSHQIFRTILRNF